MHPVLRVTLVSGLLLCSLHACSDPPSGGEEDAFSLEDTGGGDVEDGGIDSEDDLGTPDTANTADTIEPGDLEDGEICLDDRDCQSTLCIRPSLASNEGFCTSFCFEDDACAEDWECTFLANSGGDAVRVCVPDDLCIDRDEDGYGLGAGCAGLDCDDDNAAINPAAQETCDGIDNDCDGLPDDNPAEAGGECDTGFSGACSVGRAVCLGGSVLCEPNRTPSDEICDGIDNDCDTLVDEGDDGAPLSEPCYGGAAETLGVGQCVGGVRTCDDGQFGNCLGQRLPYPELCDAVDNDCDAAVDEGAVSGTAQCSTGLLGACAVGFTGCGDDSEECVPAYEPTDEICDGVDNDCDGVTDEAEGGEPLARTCYDGDPTTLGIGTCVEGTQTCQFGEFGPCLGDRPPGIEICDGADNDCDGTEDEDAVGGGASCATGRPGICAVGVAACETGGGEGCVSVFEPTAELCDGLDNDCDGVIDEAEGGGPLVRDCYDGADGTEGVGACTGGVATCVAGQYSSCSGQVVPAFELCDGIDNDCDGVEDEDDPQGGSVCDTGLDGVCSDGRTACEDGALVCLSRRAAGAETCNGLDDDCDGDVDEDAAGAPLARTCFEGDSALIGIGQCAEGQQTCQGGEFGACLGDVIPSVELCDGEDNDCDGVEDEDAIGGGTCNTGTPGVCAIGVISCETGSPSDCTPLIAPSMELCDGLDNDCDGETDEGVGGGPLQRDCYTGPGGTEDVGLCDGGTETCVAGLWSSCQGQTTPSFELCDGEDNDCDGDRDEGNPEAGFTCTADALGICANGTTVCSDGVVTCESAFTPTAETCDGFDNDCDGDTDEDEAGEPLSRPCYDGPAGTEDVGSCVGGTQTCRFGDYGGCVGQVIPVTEVCDYQDNDCDDDVDEGALLPFYLDADRDGFGDPETVVFACEGDGYVTNGLDCYDDNSAANPEQEGFFGTDRGDGSFDYNCDDETTSFFGGFGSCSSDPPLCYLQVEGWLDDGSGIEPDCGETGIYIFDCLGNGNNCDPTTATTTQRCH